MEKTHSELIFAGFPSELAEMGRVYRFEENGNSFKVVASRRVATVQKMDARQ